MKLGSANEATLDPAFVQTTVVIGLAALDMVHDIEWVQLAPPATSISLPAMAIDAEPEKQMIKAP